MFAIMQAASRDGLTFADVLANIPHDAGAVLVYTLVLLVGAFMWYGSRKKPS